MGSDCGHRRKSQYHPRLYLLQELDDGRRYSGRQSIPRTERGLATVYKTLDTFVQHGLVQQLNLGEDSYRYDADTSKHSHIQCTKCKAVMDLPMLQNVTGLRNEVQTTTGFKLSHEQLYFYGLCPSCQK